MTTFEMSELEIKAWAAWDHSQVLDSMGYSSYQEYLDEQAREAEQVFYSMGYSSQQEYLEEYRDFNESREF